VVTQHQRVKPGMVVRIPWGVGFVDGVVVDVYGADEDQRVVVRVPAHPAPGMDEEEISVPASQVATQTNVWPRDSYSGPGGGLYTGPGGGLYTGPGGGAYTGPGGGAYTGPGGGAYTGPGGGLSTGPGGGLSTGPGGGLYAGPGGGLYAGPGGGLYAGPGGGLYAGPTTNPYRSSQPPRPLVLRHLRRLRLWKPLQTLEEAWGLGGGKR
jgi:hypothetical protein